MALEAGHSFVREVWTARHGVELSASARFGALARRMTAAGAPRTVTSLAARASLDEVRHAGHCQTMVSKFGGSTLKEDRRLVEYAPRSLDEPARLLYEVTAQCCVAETESMSTLLVLMDAARSPELRDIVHELARDEVNHSRIGWGYLAWAKNEMSLAPLAELLPQMLEGNSSNGIFAPVSPLEDGEELLRDGVVPASLRREVYVKTLEEVVFPGFEEQRVSTAPARAWLAQKLSNLELAP